MLNQFSSTKTTRIHLPIMVSLFSFLTYLNTLHHQFVFDDFRTIVDNQFIKNWNHFPAFFSREYFKLSGELSYRPLVTLTYCIDHSIGNLNPFGYHLTNVIIHLFNVLLLNCFIKRLTKNARLAFVSCLLFSFHPILTEAVNSIGFREDLLCAAFLLLTLFFYIKTEDSYHKKTCYVIALLSYCFSLLSKETAIATPFILFAADWFFLRQGKQLKPRFAKYYQGFIVVSGIYLLFRLFLFKSAEEHFTYPGNSMITNFFTMAKVTASYVKLWVFPVVLNADYHVATELSAFGLSFLLSFALLISLGIVFLRLIRKQKELAFCMFWCFITLLPVLNIIPIGNIMAERYLYIPSLGFCFFLGLLFIKTNASPLYFPRNVFTAIFIFVLIFYFAVTIRQNKIWHDEKTLWAYMVNNTSCSFNAHNNLGKVYFQEGNIDRAIKEYSVALEKASEINYKFPAVHYNLGLAYAKEAKYDKSIREFKNALQINNRDCESHNNLGIMYFKTRQTTLAIDELKKAIELDPANPAYHYNLSLMYKQINMLNEAMAEEDLARNLRK